MGTTTFYLRHNDIGPSLDNMTKKDIEKLCKISPYGEEISYLGWHTPFELHNGNVYILVFRRGRLMKLEETPKLLNRKYYDKYNGKTRREYEWTLLKNRVLREIEHLDKEFKKDIRKR